MEYMNSFTKVNRVYDIPYIPKNLYKNIYKSKLEYLRKS